MSQKISDPTEATSVTLSPLARVVRTVIQVVIAVGGSIPIILATTTLSGPDVAKVESIVATAVAVVSTIQNLLEHYGVIPVAGGKAPATPPAKSLTVNVAVDKTQVTKVVTDQLDAISADLKAQGAA